MPYIPADMENHQASAAQQFVLGTNTFNQAQQNLMHGAMPGPESTMFIPNQVLNRPQTMTAQGNFFSLI